MPTYNGTDGNDVITGTTGDDIYYSSRGQDIFFGDYGYDIIYVDYSGLGGGNVPDAALNYVWDNRNPAGTRRKSAYTDRAELIVAETGTARAGTWVTERVDVVADFALAFGNRPGTPIQIAIASDTDNTGSIARAAFADLRFVARRQSCS